MKKLVCITCPNGCELTIDENNKAVTGNKCKRGQEFAINELTKPMRTICSSVQTVFADTPVVSVKVSNDIPKDKIFDVMNKINEIKLDKRLGIGDVVISNVLDLGVDVIITSNILKENANEK